MSDTVIFYHNPMSRGRIVHWMLEELEAPYEVRPIDFEKREHKSAEFLALNPMGKLPTIVHRGVVVTETAAICMYLADAFAPGRLAPALDDPRRGTYLRWMFFAAGCVEPAMVDKSQNRPPVERVGAVGWGTYEDTVDTLEKAITPGPYILGDQFTAADVYVGSQITWSMFTKALEPRPAFQAYSARLSERPAAQRMRKASEG
jgi:glutathione S-transferase